MGLAACGDGSYVKDIQVRSYNENNQAYAEVAAMLPSGNLPIQGFEYPLSHPSAPDRAFGKVALVAVAGGDSRMLLTVNVSEVAKLPASTLDNKLPNGTSWPGAAGSSATMVAFNIGDKSGSKVYVDLSPTDKKATLGVAFVVPSLNSPVKAVVNMMPAFNMENGLTGNAGLFFGVTPNTSGFGLMVDASKAITNAVDAEKFRSLSFTGRPVRGPVKRVDPAPASNRDMMQVYRTLMRVKSSGQMVEIE